MTKREMRRGVQVKVCDGSGIDSGKVGSLTGSYEMFMGRVWYQVMQDNGETFTMLPARLFRV